MAMIYGEGERAFRTLEEEIIKESDHHSLYAWALDEDQALDRKPGVLATSPADVKKFGNIVTLRPWNTAIPPSMTSKGLRIELPIYTIYHPEKRNLNKTLTLSTYGLLNCRLENNFFDVLALPLHKVPS